MNYPRTVVLETLIAPSCTRELCFSNKERSPSNVCSRFPCKDRQGSSFPISAPCPHWAGRQYLSPETVWCWEPQGPQAGVNLPVQPKELRGEHKGLKESCQHGYRLEYPRPSMAAPLNLSAAEGRCQSTLSVTVTPTLKGVQRFF